ncbi:MAG: ABC transporter ATP-binding protein [Atopobiaceae bacterium]|nr:ABC transporter ATP-binding protein [Atopobiaceae bacterium]
MKGARAGSGDALLTTVNLSTGYDGVCVVGSVDLEVRRGQIVTLIGPNGAGKSTVLKTLAGQLAALGGVAYLDGRRLDKLTVGEQALLRAMLLTDRPRTELLTCEDVVQMGRHPHTGRMGVLGEADFEAVEDAMRLLDVCDLRNCDFMRISDGQRQRVLLARAVCQDPQLLILDEPTSYLDIRYQIELLGVLRHLAKERGLGIIMSLHELSLARQVSDWLVCIKDGAVMAQGSPTQIVTCEVIDRLFDLEPGTFDPLTGNICLPVGHAGTKASHGRASLGPCGAEERSCDVGLQHKE